MTQNLYIIRGLPGSGKTTYATELSVREGIPFYEADQHFVVDGEYRFDRDELHIAHQNCFDRVSYALHEGVDVIVSNTFTTLREMKNYIKLALELGVKVHVIHTTGDFGSVHGVPEHTIKAMKDRWISNEELSQHYDDKIHVIELH